jgi:hypothetical protein
MTTDKQIAANRLNAGSGLFCEQEAPLVVSQTSTLDSSKTPLPPHPKSPSIDSNGFVTSAVNCGLSLDQRAPSNENRVKNEAPC